MKKNLLFKGVAVLGAVLLLTNTTLPGLQAFADSELSITDFESFKTALATGGDILIGGNIELTDNYVNINQDTNIDLGGHILTINQINFTAGKTITLYNGTININDGKGGLYVNGASEVTLDGLTINGYFPVGGNATNPFKKLKIIDTTINGTTEPALYLPGTTSEGDDVPETEIIDSTLKGCSGIEMRSGKLSLKNSHLISTCDENARNYILNNDSNRNGTTDGSAALYIHPSSTYNNGGEIDINISDNTILENEKHNLSVIRIYEHNQVGANKINLDSDKSYSLSYEKQSSKVNSDVLFDYNLHVSDQEGMIEAISNNNVSTITIDEDFTVNQSIIINRPLKIDGNSKTIRMEGNQEYVEGGNNYILKVYPAEGSIVKLDNLKLTGALGAIILGTNSTIVAENLDVSGNKWGGIELKGKFQGTIINNTEEYKQPTLWYDGSEKPDYINVDVSGISEATIESQIQYYLNEYNSKLYTVSFNANEGVLGEGTENLSVKYGTKISKPEDPTKEGYSLLGWYLCDDPDNLENTTCNAWNFDEGTIEANIQLVAKWAKVSSITLGTISNGKVTFTAPSNGSPYNLPNGKALSGEEVTLTATPDSNYNFGTWTVKDADNNAITVTDNKFTMPAKDVTVSATFTAKPTSSGGGSSGGSSSSSSSKTTTTTDTKKAEETKTENKTSEEIELKGEVTEEQTSEKVEEKTAPDNNYSKEFNDAYSFAHKNGITTMESIEKADMNAPLTRIAMAKMLSQYAINVLGKTPDTTKVVPNFSDVSAELDAEYNNGVTLAYQLGIMGIGIEKFRPFDLVTRAEFGTALSRMLFGLADGDGAYYETHLAKLMEEKIITVDTPDLQELRGYVMIMLMRSANK